MPWSEVREIRKLGWHIGTHTVSHPNLSNLAAEDPGGEVIREESDRCNGIIEENKGLRPAGLRLHQYQMEQLRRGRGKEEVQVWPTVDRGIGIRGGRQTHSLR